MLYDLHVRDLALIERADVTFGRGLNILTGETGAGKSVLIGSINMALGLKTNKDMIRSGCEYAAAEMVFGDFSEEETEGLRALEVEPEEGQVIIRRKLGRTRSEIRINDETATVAKLKKVTELLLDIHGQHEHQSLLREGSHLQLLDAFQQRETGELRTEIRQCHQRCSLLREKLEEYGMDEDQRLREMDFLQFEIDDIEDADVRDGEEESLAAEFRRLQNNRVITEAVSRAKEILEGAELSMAVREIQTARKYDDSLKDCADSIYDLESIAEDTIRSLDRYLDGNTCDEESLETLTERLDRIRGVMAKHGGTPEKVRTALEKKKERLLMLQNYSAGKQELSEELERTEKRLRTLCEELTLKRKAGADVLCGLIRREMEEMGFLDTRFSMAFSALPVPGSNGGDEAHFEVSLNPGEPERPLSEVASGGELSRIMLSIKTVLADKDAVGTLIFDEVDTGISGRTAEKVAEKLQKIAGKHQVILITHLPQIAAKAENHFLIEKTVEGGHTSTHIRQLSEQGSEEELARLLAGGAITETALANARELKSLAKGGRQE